MAGVLPGVAFQVVPTGDGPFECVTTTIRLGTIALQSGSATPYIAFAKTRPGTCALQIPLESVNAAVFNGVAGFADMVGTFGSEAELLRASTAPFRHSALVLPVDAAEALLEPPPGSALLRPGAHAFLRADPAASERALRVIRAAEATAADIPDVFEVEEARRALRDTLLHAARALLRPGTGGGPVRVPRSAAARRRVVAAADAYLRAHIDRPIYTEELCDALAVSASSLAEAFRAVFAVSPHRFLKLRRLGLVHAALRCREGPAPLVKSVALSHGFWHLGQFAHDYRAVFVETPSETLARARGQAAVADEGGATH